MQKISLDKFANGALNERANAAISEVLANIADRNTDATKKRTVTITLAFTADDSRDLAMVDIEAKTKLVPATSVGTKVIIDIDTEGQVIGQELKSGIPGQTMIDAETGEVMTDVGQPISEIENDGNIVDFRKSQSK